MKNVADIRIKLDKILGKGAFSTVYFGYNKVTKQEYAIKEISNDILRKQLGDRGQEALQKEVNINLSLMHKNIVRLH